VTAQDAALLDSVANGFPPGITRAAVAVSGGGDSMALLHLLARVAPAQGIALQAVTVDHRLRTSAASEAAFVANTCAGLGVPHTVLIWHHDAVRGNLMEQARLARRDLIAAWAAGEGVQAVALAHTADDQAEGFLMALARESGLDGLSGMPRLLREGGLCWVRPLLGATRADLRDWLAGQGLDWIEDPTNADPRYLRTRARAALAALADLGLTAQGIARSAAHLAAARRALEDTLAGFVQTHVTEQAGALAVPRAAFAALPADLQRRLVAAVVRWIASAPHPPRRSGQLQVLAALQAGRSTTLGGVRFRVGPQSIRIVREPRAVGGPVPVGALWDDRWQVTGPPGEVRALGAGGLAQVPGWRACGIPRDALVVSPGIWDGARLIAAPLAGFGAQSRATCGRSLASFLVSH
jgi:tRNA(Ile)-lysidine synthase